MAESDWAPAYLAPNTSPKIVDKQRILREKTLIKRIRELHVGYNCEISLDIVYKGDHRGVAAHHIIYKSSEHTGRENVTWESLNETGRRVVGTPAVSDVGHISPGTLENPQDSPMQAMSSRSGERFPELLPLPSGEYADLSNHRPPTPPSLLPPGWDYMRQGPSQMNPPCGPKAIFPITHQRYRFSAQGHAPPQPWDPSNMLPRLVGYKHAGPGHFSGSSSSPYAFSVASGASGQQPVYIDLSQKLNPIVTDPSEWWAMINREYFFPQH